MADLDELLGSDKTLNAKKLAELEGRVSKLEKDKGISAPTEMEMYGGDKGFHKFGSEKERRVWELNQRLDRIQRGGKDVTVELLKLDLKKGNGDKEAIVDDLVYRPHEHTIEAQLGRLEKRIEGMEKGITIGKDLPIDLLPLPGDKGKGIIADKPAVADKDAVKVAESIKAEKELELPLKMYEKATEDMEKFKKELFEKGKTKDGKVNLGDLSKDERDKYAKLEKKLNAAGEILKLEVQEKMPHLKEEYVDAAINQMRKDTAAKTNKTEITIQNDIIDLEPKLKIKDLLEKDLVIPDGKKGKGDDIEKKIEDFLKKAPQSKGDSMVVPLSSEAVSPKLVAAKFPVADKSGKIEL